MDFQKAMKDKVSEERRPIQDILHASGQDCQDRFLVGASSKMEGGNVTHLRERNMRLYKHGKISELRVSYQRAWWSTQSNTIFGQSCPIFLPDINQRTDRKTNPVGRKEAPFVTWKQEEEKTFQKSCPHVRNTILALRSNLTQDRTFDNIVYVFDESL